MSLPLQIAATENVVNTAVNICNNLHENTMQTAL